MLESFQSGFVRYHRRRREEWNRAVYACILRSVI